jgi:hypothetical protein
VVQLHEPFEYNSCIGAYVIEGGVQLQSEHQTINITNNLSVYPFAQVISNKFREVHGEELVCHYE